MKNKPFSFKGGLVGFLVVFIVTVIPVVNFLQYVMERIIDTISGNHLCFDRSQGPEFYCSDMFQILVAGLFIIVIYSLVGIVCGFFYAKYKSKEPLLK
jgi:hypothetical protein